MKSLLIVGGGGHARVVADIIADAGIYSIAGFVAPAGDYHIPQLERLGDDSIVEALIARGVAHAAIAIGDNALRKRLWTQLSAIGYQFPALVHPSATISRHARIGEGTVVMPNAAINTGTVVGRCAIVNTGASIDHDGSIGDFAHVAPGCALAGTVTVEEGAFLGVGTSVIPGRRIGAWSVIGAGACIVTDIGAASLALGVPARIVRMLAEEPR